MTSSKKRGRPTGRLSSLAHRDFYQWFAVGSEVARRVLQRGKKVTTRRIIDDVAAEVNLSRRQVERTYGDFCEFSPGSAPGAKPSTETWLEAFAKMKVNPNVSRAIFSSVGKVSPEAFRGLLLPGTEPSSEYAPRNMFKKRKVRRLVSAKRR